MPCEDCLDELFPEFPTSGTIAFELSAGPMTPRGEPVSVGFAVPFPPGVVTSADRVAIFAGGDELATHVEEAARWRSIAAPADAGSVRSVRVTASVTFDDSGVLPLEVRYGVGRTAELPAAGEFQADWREIADDDLPVPVAEPAAYAAFSPGWLSACLLRSRVLPVGHDTGIDWFDTSLLGYAATAVNDVPAQVTTRIDLSVDEPWLYDRAASLFGVYARTGDAVWLRRAHRAARFYASHLSATGYFDLKTYDDLKYSYGQSLMLDRVLTGADDLTAQVVTVADAGIEWKEMYTTSSNFWTERHQTYALLAAVSAFEATGEPAHADRARAIIAASNQQFADPAGTWQANGCILHSFSDHEGGSSDAPICSPWMSALLSDAVWRYYLLSADDGALEMLAELAEFVHDYALYNGASESMDRTVPWYVASSAFTWSDDGAWGDMEHACDVAGLVARGAWARRELGGDPAELRASFAELLETCEFSLNHWHRPAGPASGLAEWRLSPPRKFSWWFGTTLDMPWFARALAAD